MSGSFVEWVAKATISSNLLSQLAWCDWGRDGALEATLQELRGVQATRHDYSPESTRESRFSPEAAIAKLCTRKAEVDHGTIRACTQKLQGRDGNSCRD